MVIDSLTKQAYATLHPGIQKAFEYLHTTELAALPSGRYEVVGNDVFAMVQEYDTKPTANCAMEAHKKHIDVQYMVQGSEQVGHALLHEQTATKQAYSDDTDFMLFDLDPAFTSVMAAGTFMIFYPGDIHMSCIQIEAPAKVKKVVVKVKIG